MPEAPVRAVIFDLDGTLVQTRVASWEIFRRIDERFDLGVDQPEKYFELFNGNVFRSIRRLMQLPDEEFLLAQQTCLEKL